MTCMADQPTGSERGDCHRLYCVRTFAGARFVYIAWIPGDAFGERTFAASLQELPHVSSNTQGFVVQYTQHHDQFRR